MMAVDLETTLFGMWRSSFGKWVQEPGVAANLKTHSLAEDLRSWTSDLTTAVVRSCEWQGWVASARWNPTRRLPKVGKEYLSLDVVALPAGDKPLWPLPIAVFELENSQLDRRVAYSLWKVICIRAALRVVFAYRPDWDQSRGLVERLGQDVIGGLSFDEREAITGQTVVVVGNRGEGETFPWGYFKFWMLNTNLGRFEKV
jgi:hypothetical protein